MALLLISVGLFIPSKLYGWGPTRAIGFTAAVLATGVSVAFASWAGLCAYRFFSDQGDDFALLGVLYGAAFLAASGYAGWCAFVLLKKLDPEKEQTVATIAVGIAVGALTSYPLIFRG